MTEPIEDNLSQDAQDFIQQMKNENPEIKKQITEMEKTRECKSEGEEIKKILAEIKEKDPSIFNIILDSKSSFPEIFTPNIEDFLSKQQEECMRR